MKCQVCGSLSVWRNLFGIGSPYVQCTVCGATFECPPPEDDDEDEDEELQPVEEVDGGS